MALHHLEPELPKAHAQVARLQLPRHLRFCPLRRRHSVTFWELLEQHLLAEAFEKTGDFAAPSG